MNAQTTARTAVFTVKRMPQSASKCFGVYDCENLLEGGFFSRDAAEECRNVYEEEFHARAALAKAGAL